MSQLLVTHSGYQKTLYLRLSLHLSFINHLVFTKFNTILYKTYFEIVIKLAITLSSPYFHFLHINETCLPNFH